MQSGHWGDSQSEAFTDALRVNRHIRVVGFSGMFDDMHNKFGALATPTVAIEKFSAGRSVWISSTIERVCNIVRPDNAARSAPAHCVVGLSQALRVNGALRRLKLCELCRAGGVGAIVSTLQTWRCFDDDYRAQSLCASQILRFGRVIRGRCCLTPSMTTTRCDRSAIRMIGTDVSEQRIEQCRSHLITPRQRSWKTQHCRPLFVW